MVAKRPWPAPVKQHTCCLLLLYYDNESHDHAVCMPYIPGTRKAMAGDVRYKKWCQQCNRRVRYSLGSERCNFYYAEHISGHGLENSLWRVSCLAPIFVHVHGFIDRSVKVCLTYIIWLKTSIGEVHCVSPIAIKLEQSTDETWSINCALKYTTFMFQAARIATSGHTITGRKCLYDADGRF